MEQQKQFFDAALEDFARVFKTQTNKIVEALKTKEEKWNNLPLQLLLPLQKLKLGSFCPKISGRHKMTGTETAIETETNSAWTQQKTEKVLKIKRKYKVELTALRKDSSTTLLPQFWFSTLFPLLPALSELQIRMTNINSSIHIFSFDLESSEDFSIQFLPAPCQSDCTKTLACKLESQKNQDAEQAAQETKSK